MNVRSFLCWILCLSFLLTQDGFAQLPQNIVGDGKTKTNVDVKGSITDVTTETIRGANAFNSFSYFNVASGNTVNLFLPTGTDNLLNLINSQSTIDGLLNSIKNGQIGGNVFFINPYGVIIGTSGVINAGSLVIVTPTASFTDQFFRSVDDPSDEATAAILDGTVPISSDGLIVVRGKINALSNIRLAAGTVTNSGAIDSGAVYVVTKPDFSDVVNMNGLQDGTGLSIVGGNIEIVGTEKIEAGGTISTRKLGASGQSTGNSGNLAISAPTINVNDGASLLAGVNNQGGTSYIGGNVLLQAKERIISSFEMSIADVFQNQRSDTKITVGTATINGKDVTITAASDTEKSTTLEPQDMEDPNDPSKNLPTIIPEGLSFVVSEAKQLLPPIEGLAAAVISPAKAEINIGAANITASNDAKIEAKATAETTIKAAGVYVSYGKTDATAKVNVGSGAQITAGNSLTLNAETSNKLEVEAQPITGMVLKFAEKERTQTGPTIAVAYGKGISTSTAGVESGATLQGKTVIVTSKNENEFKTKVDAKSYSGTTAGGAAGVAIGDYDSTSHAYVNGSVTTTQAPTSATDTTGSLTVSATSTNKTETSAEASVKENKNPTDGDQQKNDKSISDAVDSKKTDQDAGESSAKLSAAGAVTIVSSNNEAHASIGTGASLVALGDFNLNSLASEEITVKTKAESSEASLSVGGAVAITNYTNTAESVIGSGAEVDAGRNLGVKADANVVNPNIDFLMDLALGGDFDKDRALELGKDILTNFIENLVSSDEKGWKGKLWDATKSTFFDTFLNTQVESTGAASASGGLGIGGNAEFLTINNKATAAIDSASINQKSQYRNDSQLVALTANGHVRTGNSAGVSTETEQENQSGSGSGSGSGSSSGTSVGIGGSYSEANYTNTVKAYIADGAKVAGSGLDVKANSSNLFVNWASAGSEGQSIGISGVFGKFTLNNTTDAHIEEGATVDVSTSAPGANADVNVEAHSENYGLFAQGVTSSASTFGLGASVGVNKVTDLTTAYIGNTTGDVTAGGTITADNVLVNAISKERFFGLAYGYMATKEDSQADKKDAKEGGGKGYGFGISGNIVLNTLIQTVDSHISDADVTARKNLNVKAATESLFAGLSGTLITTSSGGLTGAYSQNTQTRTTKAYLDSALIHAVDVAVKAESKDLFFAVSAGGSFSGKYVNVAGSVNNNSITNITTAAIDDKSDVTPTGTLAVDASNSDLIVTVAGAVTTSGKLAVGAGVDIEDLDNTVTARINDSKVEGSKNVQVTAKDKNDIYSFAAALAVASDIDIGGATVIWDVDSNTQSIIGTGSNVSTPDNLLVTSSNDLWMLEVAGNIGGGEKAGVGVSAVVNTIDLTSKAIIEGGATVEADGNETPAANANSGVMLSASNKETLKTFAAGADGGGKAGVAGSAVVNILTDNTEASVGSGAKVNEDTSNANPNQTVAILASDSTDILSVAGGAAGGGKAGIGAGADVGVIEKHTKATVDDSAVINALNDIVIKAMSDESVFSVAAALSGAGSFSLGVSASVYVLTNETKAYVGAANLDAGDSALISAQDDTHLILLDGNIGGSGSTSVGASGAVTVIDKDTTATTGAVIINARGNGSPDETAAGVAANNGQFNLSYPSYASKEVGTFEPPDATQSDVDKDNLKLTDVFEDKVFTGHRTATPVTTQVQGVAVTATSTNDLLTLAAGGQASGSFAVPISAGVNIMDDTTTATIGKNAQVNQTKGSVAPNDQQSVLVAAGSDYGHFGVAGGIAISGTGAIVPAADLNFVELKTTANIGENAKVTAEKDVSVKALAQEDFYSIAGAIAGSGQFTLAGSVSLIKLDNITKAFIDKDATVKAGNNIEVKAQDDTDVDILAGAGSLGLGVGGLGGSVGISLINKDTDAYIGTGASTDANALTNVWADTYENLRTFAIAGSAGMYVGIAGAVSVEVVNSDTSAAIMSDAKVNQNVSTSEQDVKVQAENLSDIGTFNGSLGVSIGGGIAGAVDVGSIKNDTSASIASATVDAGRDVGVTATQSRDIESDDLSIGGGLVGLAASVAVWGVSSQVDANSLKSDTYHPDGENKGNYSDVQSFTDDQITSDSSNSTTSVLIGKLTGADTTTTQGEHLADAASRVSKKTEGSPVTTELTSTVTTNGTTAQIIGGDVTTGGALNVKAQDDLKLVMATGSGAVGVGGVGGAVNVADVGTNTAATLNSNVNATGNVSVTSSRTANFDGFQLALQAGVIGLGAAYGELNDTSTNIASLGGTLSSTNGVLVDSNTYRDFWMQSAQGGIGLAIAGASIATIDAGGSTKAVIEANTQVGQDEEKEVQSLQVTSTDNTTATSDAWAVGGGALTLQGAVPIAKVKGETSTTVGNSAMVNVQGSLSVTSAANQTAKADAHGFQIALAKAGGSYATASAESILATSIGESAQLGAGGSVEIKATYNELPTAQVSASGTTSGGSLLGLDGSSSSASATPNVSVKVGKNSTIVAEDGDLAISSQAAKRATATASAESIDLLKFSGTTSASSAVGNTNTVSIAEGASVSGNNVSIAADTTSVASTPTVVGSAYGIADYNTTVGKAYVTGSTSTSIAGDVTADDNAVIRATVAERAVAKVYGVADAGLAAGATVRSYAGAPDRTTSVDTPAVSIEGTSSVSAKNLTVRAEITKLQVEADSDSYTSAVADTSPTAEAYVYVIANPSVTIQSGAELIAPDSMTLSAILNPDADLVHTYSTTYAEIMNLGFTGKLTSIAENWTTFDPSVNVADGATLRTASLTIESKVPEQSDDPNAPKVYIKDAQAKGTTVVTWVLTKVQSVVNAIFGWIPFVRKIIKWIFKWVAEITHSDQIIEARGDYFTGPAIHMNGTLYQGMPTSFSPYLVVDPNGNITNATSLTAAADGTGNIVVSDIVNNLKAAVTMNAPGGVVDGDFDIHQNNAFQSVTLINNSIYNLIVNSITPLSTNGGEANLNVDANDVSNLRYTFVAENLPTPITVQNNSTSNVVFNGTISNASGELDVTNTGGSILGTASGSLQAHDISLAANHGSIGNSTSPLNMWLVSGNPAAQYDTAGNPTLTALAGRDINANIIATEYVSLPEAVPGRQVAAEINSVLAGGKVNLNLSGQVLLATQVENTIDLSSHPATGVFNFNNEFTAAGDINLATASGTQLNVNGTMTSGLTDIDFAINADGSTDPSKINWAESIDGQNVNVTSIQQAGGHIAVTGDAVLGGAGTMKVLDGYSHIAVNNKSSRTLTIGDLNVGTRTNGSIQINGVAAPLNGNLGTVNTASYGYGSGLVNVTNEGASDVVLTGTISNPTGTTSIANALGNITRAGTSQVVQTKDLSVAATNGQAGSTALPLNVQMNGGSATINAKYDVGLNAVSGDLKVASITSTAGDVAVTVKAGKIDVRAINALSGLVSLWGTGSILNADNRETSNIAANSVDLVSTTGSIGTATTALNLNTAQGGSISAQAATGINIVETTGNMNALSVRSNAGNVSLTSQDADLIVGIITANTGNVVLDAYGSILSGGGITPSAIDGSLLADVIGNNLNFKGQTGSIGTEENPIYVDAGSSGTITAAANNDIHVVEISGDLNANSVTSAEGDITLGVEDGDANLDTVAATSGDVAVVANGSILNAGSATSPNVSGQNLLLNANQGTIGESAKALVTSAYGSTETFATDGIFLHQLRGRMIAPSVSSDGDIDATIDFDTVDLQLLSAPDNVALVVNGTKLNIDTVEDPTILKINLTGTGGTTTIGELYAGKYVYILSDYLSIGRFVHTSMEPIFFDIMTTLGGPNLRPIEPGVAAASSAAANQERLVKEKLDPANRPASPETTVTDKTVSAAMEGGAQ
ncbi:MAG TPA: leukotoxin LktA family filamentous adhesin [Terriglobales bacterium]|nr:leukotoxin LktA family filamentous adhesin [Terriglobales bacterium]